MFKPITTTLSLAFCLLTPYQAFAARAVAMFKSGDQLDIALSALFIMAFMGILCVMSLAAKPHVVAAAIGVTGFLVLLTILFR